MDFQQLASRFNLQSEIFAIIVVLLAITLILFLNRSKLQIKLREWRVQRCLNGIGHRQIRNLICPDGLDGYFAIDRIALVKDAIVVISYKRYPGHIYCSEHIAEWTQVVGQKSFKFENPLFELDNQLTALRLLCGDTAVKGFLFFNHSATFPKGHPDCILHPDNIPEAFMHENCATIDIEISKAWQALESFHKQSFGNNHISVKT